MSFLIHAGDVIILVRRDSDVMGSARGAVVAFEVDAYDAAERLGWSVSVMGPSRRVTDPVETASHDRLPWGRPAAPDHCYITVRMALVQGWQTMPVSEAVLVGPPREAWPLVADRARDDVADGFRLAHRHGRLVLGGASTMPSPHVDRQHRPDSALAGMRLTELLDEVQDRLAAVAGTRPGCSTCSTPSSASPRGWT